MKFFWSILFILSFSSISAQYQLSQMADFPVFRPDWPASFSVGSKAYVLGGFDSTSSYGAVWEYDSVSNEWSQLSDFPTDLQFGSVGFTINGKGYVGLGFDSDGKNYKLWEYDVQNDTWAHVSTFPGQNIIETSVFVINDKAYIVLGNTERRMGTETNHVWEFDPTSLTWTQMANFPGQPRSRGVGFSIGEKGYAGLGHTVGTNPSDFYEFDPQLNQWTQKSTFNGQSSTDAVGFALGRNGYVGLGRGGQGIYRYNPIYDQWNWVMAFPDASRIGVTEFMINGKAYMGMGSFYSPFGTQARNDLWRFESTTLNLKPNPRKQTFHFDFKNPVGSHLEIHSDIEISEIELEIFSIDGKKISRLSVENDSFYIGHLKKGFYVARFRYAGQTFARKFIKS